MHWREERDNQRGNDYDDSLSLTEKTESDHSQPTFTLLSSVRTTLSFFGGSRVKESKSIPGKQGKEGRAGLISDCIGVSGCYEANEEEEKDQRSRGTQIDSFSVSQLSPGCDLTREFDICIQGSSPK